MQLYSLRVIKNGDPLRVIFFKEGLNLIINADSSVAKSGNSEGNTTPSR